MSAKSRVCASPASTCPRVIGGLHGGLVPGQQAAGLGEPRGERLGPADQRADLPLVAPAEHVPAAVVDPVAVVLLVPDTALDLPGLGDRPGRPAELGHRLDALRVRAAGEFPLQPGGEHGVLDLKLGGQRAAAGLGRRDPAGQCRRRDPVVDDAHLQVIAVDPVGHRTVVLVGNQDRQGEGVQQPLRRALPVGLLRRAPRSARRRTAACPPRAAAHGRAGRAGQAGAWGCCSCARAGCAARRSPPRPRRPAAVSPRPRP